MIIRPLFFEWPYINYFYSDNLIDSEFMIGKDILCIPILTNDSNHTLGFLPNESFYNFKTGEKTDGNFIFLFISLNESLPLFIRAGGIIHFQETYNVNSSYDLDNSFNLFIALKGNYANGYFIGYDELNDDNIAECIQHDYGCIWEIKFELKIIENFNFELGLDFSLTNNTLKNDGFINIAEIHLIGLEEEIIDLLYSFQDGDIFIFNEEGVELFKKANLRLEQKKLVIECGFLKNLQENEKVVITFKQNENVDFVVVFSLLIFYILLTIYELEAGYY